MDAEYQNGLLAGKFLALAQKVLLLNQQLRRLEGEIESLQRLDDAARKELRAARREMDKFLNPKPGSGIDEANPSLELPFDRHPAGELTQ